MSGSLRLLDAQTAPQPHDHIDLVLDDGRCVRYHDPRRFGLLVVGRCRSHAASAARPSRPRAARTGVQRGLAAPAASRAHRACQEPPDGFADRGGRRQHLRDRSAVRRGHRSSPGRGTDRTPARRSAGMRGPAGAGRGDRRRRHDLARLRAQPTARRGGSSAGSARTGEKASPARTAPLRSPGRSSGSARPGSAGDASGEPGSAGRRQAACPVSRRYFANSASGVST